MISEKQLKILAFPYTKYEAIICDGAIRSGKSSIMMWAFVKWGMMNFDGQRFAICGKSVDSCIKNVIQPFLAMSLARETYRLRWRRIDKVLEVQNGNTTNLFEVFGGKDESSFALIQGRTLAGVLLDEVALQPRSFVEQALARCSVTGSRFWFNCNPGPPSHWFYQEWIKQTERHKALHLHFLLEDNPALDPEIVERYKNTYAGVFYRRYILGEWCVADGLVYPMFDKSKHIATEQYSGGVYYISIDYGTLNPTAMGLWQLRNGKAVMLKEYYYDGRKQKRQKTDEEYDIINSAMIAPAKADKAMQETVAAKGQTLNLLQNPILTDSPIAEKVDEKVFKAEENEDGITSIKLDVEKGYIDFIMVDQRGEHTIRNGIGEWMDGGTTMTGNYLHHQYQNEIEPYTAYGEWKDDTTLQLTWRYPSMAFVDTVEITFSEDGSQMTMVRSVNVNSGALVRPAVTLKAE